MVCIDPPPSSSSPPPRMDSSMLVDSSMGVWLLDNDGIATLLKVDGYLLPMSSH